MDIFNRPPSISEDTLQYTIYPSPDISQKSSVIAFAAHLQALVDSLLPNFLWHRDPFQLKAVENRHRKDAWIIEGRMRVGDSVDDEWCAVWLLKNISAQCDVVVSVFDSDGEFLMIEAAEVLPSWVKPSNTENRIWIYQSHLHLIPLLHISALHKKQPRRQLPGVNEDDEDNNFDEQEDYLAADDALALVRDPTVDTQAPDSVESTVWKRISEYPAAAGKHIHVAKMYLPTDIARALQTDPSLVQKPVETFYTRDAIQLRAAHRMSRFPPQPSTLTLVKMTRTSYAQLVGQKFHPPKIFGRWQEQEGTAQWRWRDVGMKLSSGFEMLYQESKSKSDIINNTAEAMKSSAEARKDALRRNSDYNQYITNLVSLGYFKGELKDSQLWNELENKAVENFIEFSMDSDATRTSFAARFNAALSKAPETIPNASQEVEDSDDWLNVDAHDFDDMLARTLNPSKVQSPADPHAMHVDGQESANNTEDVLTKEQTSRLQDLAKKVEGFVEGEGDVEGVRFQDEEFSDEDTSDEDDEMRDSDDESEEDIAEIDSAARRKAMDNLVAPLDPSEYGQMPASFHSNSQRVARTTVESDVAESMQSPDISSKEQTQATRPIRPPILPRDEYEGVDSDDETDDDEENDDDESEDDRPQVVGEVEVDMEEEMAEFLEFSRHALGISNEQWDEIVRERKGRSAFVPRSAGERVPTENDSQKVSKKADMGTEEHSTPASGRNHNPNLDSFEAVMKAMDEELARTRKVPSAPATRTSTEHAVGLTKGKEKATTVEDEGDDEDDADIEVKMAAELKAMLEGENVDDDEDLPEGEGMDYNLIRNFLESFKSQAGLSGPVSNLAGRLQPGWGLPRDES